MFKTNLRIVVVSILIGGSTIPTMMATAGSNKTPSNSHYHNYVPVTSPQIARTPVMIPSKPKRRVIRVEHRKSYNNTLSKQPLITNLQHNPIMNHDLTRITRTPVKSAAQNGMPVMTPRGFKTQMPVLTDPQMGSAK